MDEILRLEYVHVSNADFLYIGPFFSSGQGFFLVLSTVGHTGNPRVPTGQLWAPAVRLGACSAPPKSGALASYHWISFRFVEPHRTNETRQFNIIAPLPLHHVCITPYLKLSSSLLGGSHDTTAVVHQALRFLWPPRTMHLFGCVCAVFPVEPGNRNNHMQPDINRHLLGISKQPRSHGARYKNSCCTTTVRHHQRFTLWPW